LCLKNSSYMDRNTIIGLALIGLLIVGMGIINKPAREAREAEMERRRTEMRRQDSIARVEKTRAEEAAAMLGMQGPAAIAGADGTMDTASRQLLADRFGDFAAAAIGTEEQVVLENDLLKLTFTTRGGRPYSADLKQYHTYDSLPLILFDGDSTVFNLQFFAGGKAINTGELYFRPEIISLTDGEGRACQQLTMTLETAGSASLAYVYRLYDDDYMVDFDLRLKGLDQYGTDRMNLDFAFYMPSLEKGFQNESAYTTLYYKYHGGDVESFRTRSKKEFESADVTTGVQWIAYSHQFFSTILIADEAFQGANMNQQRFTNPGKYVRYFNSSIGMPVNRTPEQTIGMKLYLGPNRFTALKSYGDLDLESVVTVGGAMIRWINAYVIIPIFNWLSRSIHNYGIIILLLTLIIKVALFPLTYRSYKSQAVMRVLKPQVDEINARYPRKEDAMKKQQATMDLYKKAGANPMGGCLPMLFQFPILYAMFRFFPTSIELRQQPFLWAHDLSTYDSILNLPFTIPMYGDHVSLFTILMTVTTILSMRWNNQASASSSAMPGMKSMMYVMPVMFMVILNNFSAGLTYYYFLANVITLGQNLIFKQFTDEEAILKKISTKTSKPAKKSRFAQRLEEFQKQQQGYRKPAPRKKSR
jgi:YidC/Oxa1 family membrane protein insertase